MTLRYIDPSLPEASARRWRATFSDWAIRRHDPATAAKLLQNSERTILKRYAAGSNSSQVSELGAYLTQVSRILEKGQSDQGVVPNATGACARYGEPQADDTSPLELDCRKPEGCLFCDKYRVHADETDVRKLLSCLHCLRLVSQSAGSREQYDRTFGAIFQRIEDLLTEIDARDPGLVARVRIEVEEGEMDPYWSSKLEMLHELEFA